MIPGAGAGLGPEKVDAARDDSACWACDAYPGGMLVTEGDAEPFPSG